MSSESSEPDNLESRLRTAERAKHGTYDKRTHHLDADGMGVFINRLILEDSPYLLQHAHNPVNWYAWGAEAFEAAKAEDTPIFLSIGYSTCHWCHVMEVESFDNMEIAALLNEDFVCIKLDREQFPDIDEIYMTAVQIMTGHGGWPMSSFLLSDGKPFYSGTYFPPQQFAHLLGQIADVWRQRRDELRQSAERISQALTQILSSAAKAATVDLPQLDKDTAQILAREDTRFGGLQGAPKFPQEPLLLYFLDQALRQGDEDALGFAVRALDGMARGGIYDQIAGGFHRYSTDAQWLLPHFEKMLYNQSQLVRAFLAAWQLSGNHYFLRIIRQTLDYVLREMQLPEGGFYTATDADSEGEEGLFFIWTYAELAAQLSPQELRLLEAVYGVSKTGNFERANILHLQKSLASIAIELAVPDLLEQLDALLEKLRILRQGRVAPLRDDKLIVSWASAMANSLALAGHALADSTYIDAAEMAVNLIWGKNFAGQESLRRIFLNGSVSSAAQLEDYANLCQALLVLFDIKREAIFLQRAATAMDQALQQFWKEESGGFYNSPVLEQGPMLARSSSASDGETLSATAVALECLIALDQRNSLLDLPGRKPEVFYQQKVTACIAAVSAALRENTAAHPSLLRAIKQFEQGSAAIIQYAGQGKLRVAVDAIAKQTSGSAPHRVEFKLSLLPGWHLAATGTPNAPAQVLALKIADGEAAWQLQEVFYPALEDPEVAYRGEFKLAIELSSIGSDDNPFAHSAGFELTVQLCNDEVCLTVERLRFRVLMHA